jgi:myo-inositol 2-dehydrogenase/D-chiro-inositol 1-dehydrogenase
MLTRRHFLKHSTTAAVGGLLASSALSSRAAAPVDPSRVLKVGLVGCGGRGTGAASQALKADPNVRLTAMADVFADRLESSLATLRRTQAARIDVTPATSFVGLDAFQKVIDSGVGRRAAHLHPRLPPAAFQSGDRRRETRLLRKTRRRR